MNRIFATVYDAVNQQDKTRRTFVARMGGMIAASTIFAACGAPEEPVSLKGTKIGTTYSKREIDWLGLNHKTAFPLLLSMGFDTVRLGDFWLESEHTQGVYDFSIAKEMLDQCEALNQAVIMTVGLKAPRWPEFYPPSWLPDLSDRDFFKIAEAPLLKFVEASIKELGKYNCIKQWQVENEPLDPSGEHNRTIPIDLLRKEIALVRSLDQRPIIVNLWANELTKRRHFNEAAQIADIVGLDLYPKTPGFGSSYTGASDSDRVLKAVIQRSPKPVWGIEIQAEAWERTNDAKLAQHPGSLPNAKQITRNVEWARNLGMDTMLLWGFEHWLKREQLYGDSTLIDGVKALLARR